jgi:3-methylcrotonyl-CoA carboxylase alpha subunit
MFDSLLIANRGEIACRIIRTARRLGLRTIAVHSDADRNALHVRMADQAVHIGASPASESYLRVERIIAAARATGAAAIHPGYGFLSERPDLARACAENGLAWVGPHLAAITSMGSKIEARRITEAAGVPCVPGYSGDDQSDAALAAAARRIGLPVMVKASAGGGGKGMRAVFAEAELASAIVSARSEAERAFGDGRLLVEKLVRNPRHIEVQLLGDAHGNLLHLFERDCSVQRNHQKLLEEAPAPNLDPGTRERLFSAALKLGRAIRYDNAGTAEFIMDGASGDFFFLEMNTRLQVEHTVTEAITGIDLVEMQLRAAAGEKLPFAQEEIRATGHAIEARLTAEDAGAGFRPQTGEIAHWRPSPDLRCDSGVEAGSTIGAFYDSMIAKLVAHGRDRAEARRKLTAGLERTAIAGVTTNRMFLRDAVQRPCFAEGRATTGFLAQEWPDGWQAEDTADSLVLAALARHLRDRPGLSPARPASPWQALGGFRLLAKAGSPARATYLDADRPDARVTIDGRASPFAVTHGGKTREISAEWRDATTLAVSVDGRFETVGALTPGDTVHLWSARHDAVHRIIAAGDFDAGQAGEGAGAADRITTPMPGLLVSISVRPGDRVAKGDTLAVMESMKLLMDLKAAASGTVTTVGAAAGDTLDAGAVLVTLDPDET